MTETETSDELEEMRTRYQELKQMCERCANPYKCPTCNVARKVDELCELLNSK